MWWLHPIIEHFPAPRFWFAGYAPFGMLTFIFSAALTVIPLRQHGRRLYWGSWVLLMCIASGFWWTLARQEESKAKPFSDYAYFLLNPENANIQNGVVSLVSISTGILDDVNVCFTRTIEYTKGKYVGCSNGKTLKFDEGSALFISLPPADYMIDSDTRTALGKIRERLDIGQKDGKAFIVTVWVQRKQNDEMLCENPPQNGIKPCF